MLRPFVRSLVPDCPAASCEWVLDKLCDVVANPGQLEIFAPFAVFY
jgi:hypothetical protein